VKTNGYEYSGSSDINAVAWYSSNSGSSTQDVATKLANELGISDMSGNVWDWCFDSWDGSGSNRVYRGGSWNRDASLCRVAFRGPAADTYSSIGFRVARSSVP
jgi:formylglycine-generating enzyme required for sulfatase activity